MSDKWNVTFRVFRLKDNEKPYYDEFALEVNPTEYVLDAIERIWAYQDRTLCFRHACHHSTCGACGMRVNHAEKLTCITTIESVTHNGGTVLVEPLRNFPIVSDLAVDMGAFYLKMDEVKAPTLQPLPQAEVEKKVKDWSAGDEDYIRLTDCIECGLCISACPVSITSPEYLGPGTLAGAHALGLNNDPSVYALVDSEDGIWRCHSAYECTAVCPSFVDPGRRIMELRSQVAGNKLKEIFGHH